MVPNDGMGGGGVENVPWVGDEVADHSLRGEAQRQAPGAPEGRAHGTAEGANA